MQVPEGWSLVVADDVCEKITKGTTPPKSDVLEVGDIPFLRVNNLSFTGKLLKSSEFIFVKKSSHEGFLARSVAYPNDILMNIVGPPLGKISLLDATYPEYNMNQAIVFFRSKVDSINSIFFLNYLYSHKTQSWLDRNSKKTSGQQNLTIEACKNIPILLPPLNEQQKIAQILSTWDKAITTTEQLLANRQQQKKALMQQLLTGKKRLLDDNGQRFSGEWKKMLFGDVFEKISNGITYDTKATEGLPVSRIETISTGKIDYKKVGWAPDDETTKRHMLISGDILYSHINSLEHIGRVAYYDAEQPLYHGMNLLLLRLKKGFVSKFFYQLLSSEFGKRYASEYAKSAVNQASISTTDIKSFKALVPSLEEQLKIATVLTTADNEITQLQQKLDQLKQEKKALMQQLLTGKRRVKVEEVA